MRNIRSFLCPVYNSETVMSWYGILMLLHPLPVSSLRYGKAAEVIVPPRTQHSWKGYRRGHCGRGVKKSPYLYNPKVSISTNVHALHVKLDGVW